MTGTVEAIHITAMRGDPMHAVESVTAHAGKGLQGDRYHALAEAGDPKFAPKRQVTLIEVEAMEAVHRDYGIEFSAQESRRNILTRGVALNHLVGKQFHINEITLRGVECSEPCNYLESLTGKEGIRKALIHRGGIRAEILNDGTINIGDAISIG